MSDDRTTASTAALQKDSDTLADGAPSNEPQAKRKANPDTRPGRRPDPPEPSHQDRSDEGTHLEALSRSFETYVRNYQDTWHQAWQDAIRANEQDVKAYEQDVIAWQHSLRSLHTASPPSPAKTKPPKS